MLVDYHLHPISHGEGSHERKILKPFFEEALRKGIRELGIADHGRYYMEFDYQEIHSLAREYPELEIRLGVELPFLPGCGEEIREIVEWLNPDYVIGSLHHLDGWMFDHPGFIEGYTRWDRESLYKRYFSLMEELVRVDSFDIIGHLDLIKVFGFRPSHDILYYAEDLLSIIAREGKAVELNTAGYRKPVKEAYPSLSLLKKSRELEIPITLGSDAHTPGDVGSHFNEAKALLKQAGYSQLVTFVSRKPIFHPL